MDISAKTKGAMWESQNKIQKISDNLDRANSSTNPLILPDDCWDNILSYSSLECIVCLFFVSKNWRRIYCRIVYRQLARRTNIPLNKIHWLPNEVKRVYSNIDTFVLLEKAIAVAKSSDFNLLLQHSTQLQKLSKMIAHIALHTNYTKFYEDERPKFNHRLDNHVIIMHAMNLDYAAIREGSDHSMTQEITYSAFTWFGKSDNYIHVEQRQVVGHDHGEYRDWLKLEYKASLKKLGSSEKHEVILRFDSEDESNKKKLSYTHDEDSDEDYNPCEHWYDFVDETKKEQIQRWIDPDMAASECAEIMKYVADGCVVMDRDGPELNYPHERVHEFQSNGNFEELEILMTAFLNNEKYWAKKIEHATKRINLKLTLMNRIKNADSLGDQARAEIFGAIERATIRLFYTQDIRFNHPGTEIRRKESIPIRRDKFCLIFNAEVEVEFCTNLVHSEVLEDDGLDYCSIEDNYILITQSGKTEQKKNNFEMLTNAKKMELIRLLELQHVSVKELIEAFVALKASITP
jgi:hypothetical protein